MNILITAPSLNINRNVSGISSVVGTIIQHNNQTNYVHFIAGKEDGANSFLFRIAALAKSYTGLIITFFRTKIALVHLNLAMNPKSLMRDYIVLVIAKVFRKRIVVHLHGGRYLLTKPNNTILRYIISHIFSNAKIVLCLSLFEKEQIEGIYHLQNLNVLENAVDDVYLSLAKGPKEDNVCSILFLGRMHESKGLNEIMHSVIELMEGGFTNINFIFCGSGPMEQQVKALAKLYSENVQFMGVVSGPEKTAILSKAQIFILPSLYGEGLPMALIEAMASGLVPIVTNDGSMKTFITNGENGIVVEKNSSAQICTAILGLLNDPNRMGTISIKARQCIADKGTIKKYVSSLNTVYENSVL